ncbi:MAG: hypothetical protein ACOX3W_05905 [Christensenellaceae bacterium]
MALFKVDLQKAYGKYGIDILPEKYFFHKDKEVRREAIEAYAEQFHEALSSDYQETLLYRLLHYAGFDLFDGDKRKEKYNKKIKNKQNYRDAMDAIASTLKLMFEEMEVVPDSAYGYKMRKPLTDYVYKKDGARVVKQACDAVLAEMGGRLLPVEILHSRFATPADKETAKKQLAAQKISKAEALKLAQGVWESAKWEHRTLNYPSSRDIYEGMLKNAIKEHVTADFLVWLYREEGRDALLLVKPVMKSSVAAELEQMENLAPYEKYSMQSILGNGGLNINAALATFLAAPEKNADFLYVFYNQFQDKKAKTALRQIFESYPALRQDMVKTLYHEYAAGQQIEELQDGLEIRIETERDENGDYPTEYKWVYMNGERLCLLEQKLEWENTWRKTL